ncbi:ABC transporter permease [Aurantimonas sp. 22II-16-19i]|uniref:ABC transporter permease n=1 Tax=Aurantimonas sp. 22II-16-19i TaxID=1317114 RepID=UPI0009F7B92F|nr:ABC transporter permease [Aurantimonas sp. 22II-16-19i]ORE91903.1 ABC transporter permease [Aurantimonas sp. 22II-16-19i]
MSGVLFICQMELRRILTLRPVFSVMILAIVIYAAFYPQPYRTEALRNVPIALVDLDGSDSSRTFARRLDASADVAIVAALPDVATAQREVFARSLHGILVIPTFFERDLLHGRPAPLALYADASYFLLYSRISGAVTALARTMGAEVEAKRLVAAHVDPDLAAAATDPMPLTAIPLFNPQSGYATYILPAAFVLLLQQTLLIGVSLLGTYPSEWEQGARDRKIGAVDRVIGRLSAYLVVEAFAFAFYLIVLPYLYGIPRLGSIGPMAAVAFPFFLAVCGLGMLMARLLRNPVLVQLVAAGLGMPLIFLAGFAWPAEAMPEMLKKAALAIPSTSAINALVNLGQLGASLQDVGPHVLTLSSLAVIYCGLAVLLEPRAGTDQSSS